MFKVIVYSQKQPFLIENIYNTEQGEGEFVASSVLNSEVVNNKVAKITQGNNCIFEIDKMSLHVLRKTVIDWYSPYQVYLSKAGISRLLILSIE